MPPRFGLPPALLLALMCAPCSPFAQELSGISSETYIKPVPIERRAPIYPREQLSQSREGWVIVSYIVTPARHRRADDRELERRRSIRESRASRGLTVAVSAGNARAAATEVTR